MSKRPTAFPFFLYVLGLLMIALAAAQFFLLPIGYPSIVAQYSASSWPIAQGRVISSELRTREADDFEEDDVYQARVRTSYRVAGEVYQLDEVYVGQEGAWTNSYSRANRLKKRYPKGKAVQVFYQPDKPRVATLEPGLKGWNYGMLVVDILFLLIGLTALAYALVHSVRFFRERLTPR